ncbi:GatB/YqeY domain-containing protein, partial [Streptomyces tanashiensis]
MTTLKAKLQDDLNAAIRERDELRSSTLRLTITAITKEEVAGTTKRELSDDEVQKVIAKADHAERTRTTSPRTPTPLSSHPEERIRSVSSDETAG